MLHKNYTRYAEYILTTAVLSIVITAPASLIALQTFGPKWLELDEQEDAEKSDTKIEGLVATESEIEIHLQDDSIRQKQLASKSSGL